MEIPVLLKTAKQKGIEKFGITDHLHTIKQMPDIEASRREYLEYKMDNFHFGVEVSCMTAQVLELAENGQEIAADWREKSDENAELAIALTKDDIERLGIEYVVAGTHWPIGAEFERHAIIRNYHRQNMFLATHPLVDILAHPWWWMGHWKDKNENYHAEPWLDDFAVIPNSMHREFASAIIESNKAVEINIQANLMNPHYPEGFARRYLEYLADLQSQGVKLSIGSDCHDAHYDIDFEKTGRMLENAGIKDDFWCL